MEVKLYLIFILIAFGKVVDATRNFFQRIDKDGESSTDGEQMVTSKGFHQCSLENNCNFFAISNDDKKFYKATTKGELPELPKQQIWEKVPPVFKSCKDAMANGHTESGIINLRWANGSALPVYCDMITDGGGWIVFQKRHSSSVNFQRDWMTYENGFGDLAGNFWLGLKALHHLLTTTKTNGGGKWMLRVDLKYSDGDQGYAKYTDFSIASAQENYKLTYGTYSGNVGDAMSRSKGFAFSTYDKDNDIAYFNCAQKHAGGWWYSYCFDAMLNNRYPGTGTTQIDPANSDFMSWKLWKGPFGNIVFFGSRTLLRLHRALSFTMLFMERLSESSNNDKTSAIASTAYSETLSKFHPWLIRKAAMFAMYTLPLCVLQNYPALLVGHEI